jgi:hypothetical protein
MYKDNNECAIAGVASVNGPKNEISRPDTSKNAFYETVQLKCSISMIRSYHREYISSRLITEIKHDWASTVVATEMGCEVDVTNLLLVGTTF